MRHIRADIGQDLATMRLYNDDNLLIRQYHIETTKSGSMSSALVWFIWWGYDRNGAPEHVGLQGRIIKIEGCRYIQSSYGNITHLETCRNAIHE